MLTFDRNNNFALRSFTLPRLPCYRRDTTLKRLQGQPSGKGGCPMRRFFRDVLVAFVAGLLVAVVAHLMGF